MKLSHIRFAAHLRRWALLEFTGGRYVVRSRHWTRPAAELERMAYALDAPTAGRSPLLLARTW